MKSRRKGTRYACAPHPYRSAVYLSSVIQHENFKKAEQEQQQEQQQQEQQQQH